MSKREKYRKRRAPYKEFLSNETKYIGITRYRKIPICIKQTNDFSLMFIDFLSVFYFTDLFINI